MGLDILVNEERQGGGTAHTFKWCELLQKWAHPHPQSGLHQRFHESWTLPTLLLLQLGPESVFSICRGIYRCCTHNMEIITVACDHLLEWAGYSMCFCANIDASLNWWAALSVKDRDKVNRWLVEVHEAVKYYVELKVLSNLVVLSWNMKYCLWLVEPDAIYQQY